MARNIRLALLVPPLLLTCGIYYYNSTRTPPFTIHYEDENVRDLERSFKTRTHLNPKGYRMYGETHSIQLEVPPLKAPAGDMPRGEAILSKFLHGFFGGWAFAPEAVVLRALFKGRDMDGKITPSLLLFQYTLLLFILSDISLGDFS